ncbi:hypothetical protein ES705_02887 [subsurface metagenome]
MFKKYLVPILIICLLFSIVVMGAPTYVNLGPTSEITGDVGVPDGSGYYISDVLFSTLGLIDISTLAKTDGGIIVGDGTNFVLETGITARTSLGLGNVENLKVKLDGTSAPGVDNDNTEGYAVGSRWIDITNDKEYVALDVSTGAAVWTETTGAGNGGYTNLTQFINQTAWRVFYSNADGDVIELPLGADGTFLESNGVAVAPSFGTPTGAGDMLKATYDTDTDNIVDKAETVDDGVGNSSTAVDVKDAVTKKHSQNTDTDLDATFEATFVKKVDTVNVLSDITSPGANIEDAVTKKHTSGSETQGGDVSGTVGNASVDKIKRGLDASKSATPAVGDIYLATDTDKLYKCITAEAWTLLKNLDLSGNNVADLADVSSAGADIEDAVTKKHTQNTDTDLDADFEATFVKKADNINVLSDITSPGADIEDAVTKKHAQNTDTALGTQTQDLNMGTHKIIGVVDPVNPQEAATKAYADTKVATEVDPTVDSDAEIKAILVDEVTKTGTFTVGRIVRIYDNTGVIEQGTVTDNDVAEAVAALHAQNTDTFLDMFTLLDSDHNYSGLKDYRPVGETVVFGDLLYFDWATKSWKKTDADAAATMPGLRIALDSKTVGQGCIMLVKGYIRDDDWDFTGAMIYASTTAGGVTSDPPSAAGQQLQRVGVAKSADILFFDPSIDVGEIKP